MEGDGDGSYGFKLSEAEHEGMALREDRLGVDCCVRVVAVQKKKKSKRPQKARR